MEESNNLKKKVKTVTIISALIEGFIALSPVILKYLPSKSEEKMLDDACKKK